MARSLRSGLNNGYSKEPNKDLATKEQIEKLIALAAQSRDSIIGLNFSETACLLTSDTLEKLFPRSSKAALSNLVSNLAFQGTLKHPDEIIVTEQPQKFSDLENLPGTYVVSIRMHTCHLLMFIDDVY